jgi:hypothetical protein
MIALAEERSFDAAPINAFDVEWLDKETRNNDRALVVAFDLATLTHGWVSARMPCDRSTCCATNMEVALSPGGRSNTSTCGPLKIPHP